MTSLLACSRGFAGDWTAATNLFGSSSVTSIPPPIFSFPLSEDAALVPRIPAIADAYYELLAANQERLAQWEPWAVTPPERDGTRAFIQAGAPTWRHASERRPAVPGKATRARGQAGPRA